MSISRREFVRTGTAAVALGAIPGNVVWGAELETQNSGQLDTLAVLADADTMRTLALRAIDAARAAGAVYADVRLTRTVSQTFAQRERVVLRARVTDREDFAVGVRALVNGYWGFAASPYWNADEVTQLAKDAVAQAKTNALGTPRQVEWGTLPAVTGTWTSPGIDPFTVPIEEKIDFMSAWRQAVNDMSKPNVTTYLDRGRMEFVRQERFMASTEGTAVLQIWYDTKSNLPFLIRPEDWRGQHEGKGEGGIPKKIGRQRGGWDIMLNARLREQVPRLLEHGQYMLALQRKPVDIGRFDVVFDAEATAGIIAQTFAIATQLDRALGFEANAGGTSYLGPDPFDHLGKAQVAAPVVNITANRSMPGGCATVQWDDEGVKPEEFSIVKNGMLVDYQTTREQAGWLKPWYEKQKQPIRSHGCASSMSALENTLQQPPNFVLTPSAGSASFESLVAGTTRGLAVMGGWASTDFQAQSGTGSGVVREIVNGKLGQVCQGAGYLFRSSEFWKNVTAVGAANNAESLGYSQPKGQPSQEGAFTVSAVPIAVKNVSIIDLERRA